tara:strand:- start:253 stop:528 length:276 start_codon:yes stop_codon:yes gene_type:complete
MTKKEQKLLDEIIEQRNLFRKTIKTLSEENDNFKKLVKYTIEDISDLFWEYDRMSSSGRETLDRLSRMYAMQYEQERNFQIYGGGNNALSK